MKKTLIKIHFILLIGTVQLYLYVYFPEHSAIERFRSN